MNNKLFCTFSPLEGINDIISDLQNKYQILYNKVFVLQCVNTDETVMTYNIDSINITDFPINTILVHRKKHTNTLYTINALNELILDLNNGILDKSFPINWKDYRNTILLTRNSELVVLKTKLHKIIEL